MPTARSSDPRFYDFDAAFAEQETIPFRLLGKMWELPATIPAATMLKIQRMALVVAKIEETGEAPDDLVIDDDLSYEAMCREMVGDELVDEWLKRNISYDMLQAVTKRLYAIHSGQDPDEGQATAGKAPTDRRQPQRASSPKKRSSRTGR